MNIARHHFWLVCATAISACATTPEADPVQPLARLSSEVQQCSRTFHYDPDNFAKMPERALVPNELSWHQCVYDAIRDYEKLNPAQAPLYNSLIAQDTLMTNALMQGQITRREWHAKTMQLLAQIKSAEEEQISESKIEQAKKEQQMRNMYDLFRSFGYGSTSTGRGQ